VTLAGGAGQGQAANDRAEEADQCCQGGSDAAPLRV
jgi:hypothetical protein